MVGGLRQQINKIAWVLKSKIQTVGCKRLSVVMHVSSLTNLTFLDVFFEGSDQELVDLLVELAEGSTQMEEPEEGSILSGQATKDDDDTPPAPSQAAVEGGEGQGDDDEGLQDALESLHMSQAWDDGTPNSEMEDADDEEEDEDEDDERAEDESYDTANR